MDGVPELVRRGAMLARQLADQPAALDEARRHRDGVAHRLGRRAAVTDDAEAVEAEERRAAVLGVVDAPAEAAERLARQQVADARAERRRQLVVQQALDRLDQPFADLQRDVAGEAVADDDVDVAGVDVAPLDVADEVDRRVLEQLVRLARQLVALALFLADRQQPDARRRAAEGDARVRRTHHARTARGAAGGTRPSRRESSSTAGCRRVGMIVASAGRSTPGSRPNAPCAAMTDAPVWPALKSASASAVADRVGGDPDRRARLAPQRRRRRLRHLDPLRRVEDVDVERGRARMARQLALDRRRAIADEQQADLQMTRGDERSVDDAAGPVVAAHRVDGDAHQAAGPDAAG